MDQCRARRPPCRTSVHGDQPIHAAPRRYPSPRMRRLVTLLIAASMLALPCAALAQSAGDEQYADPFGQVEEPNGGNNSRARRPTRALRRPPRPRRPQARPPARTSPSPRRRPRRRRCRGPASTACSSRSSAPRCFSPAPPSAGSSPEPRARRDQRARRGARRDRRGRALGPRARGPAPRPPSRPLRRRPAAPRSRTPARARVGAARAAGEGPQGAGAPLAGEPRSACPPGQRGGDPRRRAVPRALLVQPRLRRAGTARSSRGSPAAPSS